MIEGLEALLIIIALCTIKIKFKNYCNICDRIYENQTFLIIHLFAFLCFFNYFSADYTYV